MAAPANCYNLFCFTWVASSFQSCCYLWSRILTSIRILIFLGSQFFTELLCRAEYSPQARANLFCVTWVVSSLLSCCYLSSRILNNLTFICG